MSPAAPPADRRPLPSRRGDSIVEALVAVVLLTVGALALVALTATLARDERRADHRKRAAELVAARVGEWSAAPCVDGAGAASAPGLAERWRSTSTADSLQLLADSVTATADAGADAVGLALLRSCGR